MTPISHLVYSNFGGAGNVVLSLINESKKNKKFQDSVIFTGPFFDKDYKKQLINLNVNSFFFVKTIRFFGFLSWIKVFKNLLKTKPKVILLHNYQIFPCFFYSFFFKTKIIIVDHSALNYKSYRDHILIFFLKYFRYQIVVLNKENFEFYKKKKVNLNRIHIINNGIDINFYNRKKIKNLNKSTFNLGMAARIDFFKRHDLIIESLKSKKLEKIKINVFFAGNGPYINSLKKKSKNLKLNKKIIFNNKLNPKNLKKWFEKLNLYVHATTGEAMSTAILQAMSMRIPVIASRVPGNIDFFKSIRKLSNTFLNEKKILSEKIYNCYQYYDKNKKELNEIKKLIDKNYSQKQMYKKYEKLIQRIIEKKN